MLYVIYRVTRIVEYDCVRAREDAGFTGRALAAPEETSARRYNIY